MNSAIGALNDNASVDDLKYYFGATNSYGNTYNTYRSSPNPNGDPRPFQVSFDIFNDKFTAENSSTFAYATQQSSQNDTNNQYWGKYTISPAFPSGHATAGNIDAIAYAILAPGYYQQLVQSGVDFGYSRNVFGVHYPLDVIGGRILATYVVAQTLAGNALYASTSFNTGNLTTLSQSMQAYLGGGGSLPYAKACAGNVAGCVANGTIPTAAAYAQALQTYTNDLTYGLPPVGDTTLPPVVPASAYLLIATRFPYLNEAQLNQILATTELPSGVPLDDGTGWARLNLYAAAGGFGAFPSDVAVTMDATQDGLHAFDIWSNAISGPGGLTLQGSGTLILAGNDTYTGGTFVQGGTLAVTGTLSGNLTIAPAARFISGGGYAVAATAVLNNAGTFVEVNLPLINAGTTINTGTIIGDVSNLGRFANNGQVTGNFSNTGLLSGNGSVGSLALLAGSTVAPGNSVGTVQVLGDLTVAPGATYQAQIGPNGADLIQVTGTATLSGGTAIVSVIGNAPALGSSYPILTAQGGMSGSLNAVASATGSPAGMRFDALYSSNAVSLVATPSTYADLAAVGLAQSSTERAVGAALDAVRPAAGPALSGAQAALFDPLYLLPASGITAALDQLAPSIYADTLITARNTWALTAGTIGEQLASRRGLASDPQSHATAGPGGSTIWVSALGGFSSVGSGGGAPGFTAATGGGVVGIDLPVTGSLRLGAMTGGTTEQTWADNNGGNAIATAGLLVGYGAWQQGRVFVETQIGGLYQEQHVHRPQPSFGVTAQGTTDGFGFGGGIRAGVQLASAGWLFSPSVGLQGLALQQSDVTETGTGQLATSISGQNIASLRSTLSVSAQRGFAVSDTVRVVGTGRLGWGHEFADNTTNVSARIAALPGSGFTVSSAPQGRDSALVGLGSDVKVAQWPITLFANYSGAFAGDSNAQGFNAGVRFVW